MEIDIKNIDNGAIYIIEKLYENNYEGYIVGGAVRDLIMNKQPYDWDIATNAPHFVIKELFEKTIETGIKHGTVTVLLNKKQYEVTTYRIEREYYDNRRPSSVIFTSNIESDLERRDFTINSIAFNHKNGIKDLFNGIEDIKNKVIRCVGAPEKRFEEDGLRIMRALRFAAQLNFNIETNTLAAINNKKNILNKISKERIRDELNKLILSDYSSKGIKLMIETSILKIIFSDIDIININDSYMNIDLLSKNIFVRLAFFLKNILSYEFIINNLNDIINMLKNMKYDKKSIEKIINIIKNQNLDIENLKNKVNIKKVINEIGLENLFLILELKKSEFYIEKKSDKIILIDEIVRNINRIITNKEPVSVKDIAINGDEILKFGYKGKEVRIVLEKLLQIVIENPEKNNKEELIKLIESIKIK